jgi:hypothetical protein
MLFDLRSRGRRRSVKVIYTGLALLIGVGLVGFGVGSVGGGSIFESLSKEGRGGNGYAAKVTAARKRIAKNPNDAAAWMALTEAQLHEANSSENYETATERYTAKGLHQLRHVASSWQRYLQVAGAHPSVKLAREVEVSGIFGVLGQPASAVKALQIEIAGSPPSARLYSSLAEYSYFANNMRQGDLASKKALSLMPKARRPLAEQEFESVKKAVIKRNKKKRTTAGTTSSTSTTSTSSAATAKKK